MNIKIIMTGASGFIGKNIQEYFNKSYYCFYKISRFPKVNELSYNDLNQTVWDNSNICIHLAGNNHHTKNRIKDEEYFEVNTELTKKLFDQFLKSTCEVFIYMSSVKAVADMVVGELTEEEEPKPVTVYGKSKQQAEAYLLGKILPKGKRLYILRPCMVHGPGNKGNLNLLYNFLSKGIPYPLGVYDNKRSFLSVENLCFVINELINNKEISSGVYNVADNESLSTVDLVTIIGEKIGKPSIIINTPKFFVRIVAKLGDVFSLPINSERLDKLTENYVVCNSKIKREMQKDFPISARKGIIKTVKSF